MGAVALRTAALSLLLAAGHAHAHEGGRAWGGWNFDVWVAAPLGVAALLYLLGVQRLWRQAGTGRGVTAGQAACFAGGWLTLAAALVTPLDAWGQRLFWLHMVQHELMMAAAAPLLVLGRPLAAWTWALPRPLRRAAGAWTQQRHWAAAWSWLTEPVTAWVLHAAALWLWHVPSAFDAAVRSEALHIAQHASFLATALFFWWSVLGHDARGRYGPGHSALSLFATMMHTSALGALLTLAQQTWYAGYALEDQQLGGLIMWVPAALVYVGVALALLGRLLTRGLSAR